MTVASERTDLYPSRTATEVTIPRKDPVVWSPQDALDPLRGPTCSRTTTTASSPSRS